MNSVVNKTIISSIGDFLFGDDDTAPAARQSAIARKLPPVETRAAPLPAKLPAGTMQIVGLDGIRSALGDEWAEQGERIHRIAESVFRRKLDVTDAFYRVEDDCYLILFTRLGRREAAFKARVIAEEIQSLLVGELPSEGDIVVHSCVAEVDRRMVLERVQSLRELVDYVRSEAASDEDCDGITLFGAEHSPTIPETATPPATGPGPDLADLDQSLAGLFQRKTVAHFLKECRADFYPAYSFKRRSFSSYQVAVTHIPTGRPAAEVEDPFLDQPADLPFQIDRYALTTALLGVHRMLTGGRKGIVTIPVSYETLAMSKLRDVYFARLKEIPGGVTKYLGFTVHAIPPGTPGSRIAEVLAYVQPFAATRLLRLEPDPKLIDLYADTGCHAVSTRLGSFGSGSGLHLQELTSFAKRAALHRLESVLVGAASRDDVAIGVAAGFTYVSGDAVASAVNTPGFVNGLRCDHLPPDGSQTPSAA